MRLHRERLINSLDCVLLALVALWTVAIGNALLRTPVLHESRAAVEIYELAPVQLATASLQ